MLFQSCALAWISTKKQGWRPEQKLSRIIESSGGFLSRQTTASLKTSRTTLFLKEELTTFLYQWYITSQKESTRRDMDTICRWPRLLPTTMAISSGQTELKSFHVTKQAWASNHLCRIFFITRIQCAVNLTSSKTFAGNQISYLQVGYLK